MAESCKELISGVINSNKERLKSIGADIYCNPEPAFKEVQAHNLLTTYLEEEGFHVEKGHVVETGFRATFQCHSDVAGGDNAEDAKELNVCFFCEYDAAEGLGHSAAHNLTSEASVATALALKRCIEEKKFRGKITILGSPGEDSGAGAKIDMIRAGSLADVDFAMMLWPLNCNLVYPNHFTLVTVDVVYKGKAAHASAYPWEGKNALDAAVACYNNIALLRQQLKPTWMINGIIKQAGVAANTIPAETSMQFWLRAPEQRDIVLLQQKCTACFVGAAKATGCEVDFEFSDKIYSQMQHCDQLGEIFLKHAMDVGMTFPEPYSDGVFSGGFHTGSTDMGNVSRVVPSLSPAFDIGTRAFKNSIAFTEAANTPIAHENTLRAAKAMAMAAAEILSNPEMMEDIKKEYTMIRAPSGTILSHSSAASRIRLASFSGN